MDKEDWETLKRKARDLHDFFGRRVDSAIERKASEIAAANSIIYEELEEHGDGGENRSTYRSKAMKALGLES